METKLPLFWRDSECCRFPRDFLRAGLRGRFRSRPWPSRRTGLAIRMHRAFRTLLPIGVFGPAFTVGAIRLRPARITVVTVSPQRRSAALGSGSRFTQVGSALRRGDRSDDGLPPGAGEFLEKLTYFFEYGYCQR